VHSFINFLKTKLNQPLPGLSAQLEMASIERRKHYPDIKHIQNFKSSAVAICLYKENEEWMIPLMKRQEYEGVHSAQISFPGGKSEHEENPVDTALREFFEETGMENTGLLHLGALSPLYIPPSNFMVYPQVFYIQEKKPFHPNKREVQRIIEWELKNLLDETLISERLVKPFQQKEFSTPCIIVKGEIVWGATAMMLNELKEIFKSDKEIISSFLSQ
jgi:8-oxo-dGTP pyrophosphatase MutT (NUDIX family)